MTSAINWKKVVAGAAAAGAAVSAFLAGMAAKPESKDMPRVTYVQIRELKAFPIATPHWQSWKAQISYRNDAGEMQRDVPITVDVETP